jgi:predicted Rossmann-fold nucleotide-binding protein
MSASKKSTSKKSTRRKSGTKRPAGTLTKAKKALKAVFFGAATGAAEGAVTGAVEAGSRVTGIGAEEGKSEAPKVPDAKAANN